MKHELTACPRCESEQSFTRKTREVRRGYWEAYIRCSMCRWEKTLGRTTPAIEVNRRSLAKLNGRVQEEVKKYGAIQGNTARMRDRALQRHRHLTQELASRADRAS